MASRSGFVKKHVSELANDTRREFGLNDFAVLDPLALAASLDIPVIPLSALKGISGGGAEYLLVVETSALSAVTVFHGTRRRIVYNDANTPARQRSDVCHELAHGLLFHEPRPALDDSGLRDWDQVMEDEAQFMAGALLLTEAAIVAAVRRGHPADHIASVYGVSIEMARWRANATGAHRRVARERARQQIPGLLSRDDGQRFAVSSSLAAATAMAMPASRAVVVPGSVSSLGESHDDSSSSRCSVHADQQAIRPDCRMP